MKSILAIATLALSMTAVAQKHVAVFIAPDLVPAANTDYATKKPLIISHEGTYVCRDGYDMFVNIQAPKNPPKDAPKQDNKSFLYVAESSRIIDDGKQEFIPVCIQIQEKK